VRNSGYAPTEECAQTCAGGTAAVRSEDGPGTSHPGFYLPALGPIAILGAWPVTRLPGRAWLTGLITVAAITLLFTQGTQAFHAMYAAFGVPLNS
jgi:hypothetical protein